MHDITGSAAVGHAENAAILSAIAGKDIRRVPIARAALVDALIGNGLSELMANVFSSFGAGMAGQVRTWPRMALKAGRADAANDP